jgi:hypothetical protein
VAELSSKPQIKRSKTKHIDAIIDEVQQKQEQTSDTKKLFMRSKTKDFQAQKVLPLINQNKGFATNAVTSS